jgi:hypothetical protein
MTGLSTPSSRDRQQVDVGLGPGDALCVEDDRVEVELVLDPARLAVAALALVRYELGSDVIDLAHRLYLCCGRVLLIGKLGQLEPG